MITFAITQQKFTQKVRLELDEAWLTKPISMNTPTFKLDGISDFECWITCKTAVREVYTDERVELTLSAKVLNRAMKDSDEFRAHISLQIFAESSSGRPTQELYGWITYPKLQSINVVLGGKVTFLITAIYAPPHFINNDVSTCNMQLLPHEIMQFDDQSCDLKIVVGDLYIRAHKAYLSLISPVFAAMFTHNTKEAQTGAVNITDFDYCSVKTAINMLYGHPFEPNSIQEVIAVTRFAEKYMIKTAVERLETWLTGNIAIDNFGAIVEYAWTHSSDKLKHLCANFYHQHAYPGFPVIDPVISAEMVQLLV